MYVCIIYFFSKKKVVGTCHTSVTKRRCDEEFMSSQPEKCKGDINVLVPHLSGCRQLRHKIQKIYLTQQGRYKINKTIKLIEVLFSDTKPWGCEPDSRLTSLFNRNRVGRHVMGVYLPRRQTPKAKSLQPCRKIIKKVRRKNRKDL